MKHRDKLNWERLQEDQLMQRKGVENYNYKKPLNEIKSISCRFCGTRLSSNYKSVELKHLEKCRPYLEKVKSGVVKNLTGTYRPLGKGMPIKELRALPEYPDSAIGKTLTTPKLVGIVVRISNDGKKVTIVDDVGNEHTFVIEVLMQR